MRCHVAAGVLAVASYLCLSEGLVLLAAPMVLLALGWVVLWGVWVAGVRRMQLARRGEPVDGAVPAVPAMLVLPAAAAACVLGLIVWSTPGPVFLLSRGALESVAKDVLTEHEPGSSMSDVNRSGLIGMLPVDATATDGESVFFDLGGAGLFEQTGYLYSDSDAKDLAGPDCEVERVREHWWHLSCDLS
jgi:hypothetical protein